MTFYYFELMTERLKGLSEAGQKSTSIAKGTIVLPDNGSEVEGPYSDMGSSEVGSALVV